VTAKNLLAPVLYTFAIFTIFAIFAIFEITVAFVPYPIGLRLTLTGSAGHSAAMPGIYDRFWLTRCWRDAIRGLWNGRDEGGALGGSGSRLRLRGSLRSRGKGRKDVGYGLSAVLVLVELPELPELPGY
jgi:hypothetical protein